MAKIMYTHTQTCCIECHITKNKTKTKTKCIAVSAAQEANDTRRQQSNQVHRQMLLQVSAIVVGLLFYICLFVQPKTTYRHSLEASAITNVLRRSYKPSINLLSGLSTCVPKTVVAATHFLVATLQSWKQIWIFKCGYEHTLAYIKACVRVSRCCFSCNKCTKFFRGSHFRFVIIC